MPFATSRPAGGHPAGSPTCRSGRASRSTTSASGRSPSQNLDRFLAGRPTRPDAAGTPSPRAVPRGPRGPVRRRGGARQTARRLAEGRQPVLREGRAGHAARPAGRLDRPRRADRRGARRRRSLARAAAAARGPRRSGRRAAATRLPASRAGSSPRATTRSPCRPTSACSRPRKPPATSPAMQSLTQAAEVRFATRRPSWRPSGPGPALPATGAATRSSRNTSSPGRGACGTAPRSTRSSPLYLAEAMLDRGDAAGARGVLEVFLASGPPGTGAALMRLGDAALAGRAISPAPPRATQQFLEAWPASERRAEAGYLLAYSRYRQGRYAEAAEAAAPVRRPAGTVLPATWPPADRAAQARGPAGGRPRRGRRAGRRRSPGRAGPARAHEAPVPARPARRASRRGRRALRARLPTSRPRTPTPSCSPPTCAGWGR